MSIQFVPLANPRIRAGEDIVLIGAGTEPSASVDVIPRSVLDLIRSHAESQRAEVAGLLVGRVWIDGDRSVVIVDTALPADTEVETSAVHVTFRPGAWDRLSPEIEACGDDAVVVGWYHSHPSLGAFFSGTDRHTQQDFFREPWQLGIVMDPIRDETAVFRGPDCIEISLEGVRMRQQAALTVDPEVVAELHDPDPPRLFGSEESAGHESLDSYASGAIDEVVAVATARPVPRRGHRLRQFLAVLRHLARRQRP